MTSEPADGRAAARKVAAYALVALPEMTPGRLARLLERWPGPEAVVRAVQRGLAPGAYGKPAARVAASSWAGALDLDRAAARLRTDGTQVWVRGDPGFPLDPALPNCPSVLLGEGSASDALERVRVSMVGTRSATPAGLADARALGAALGEEGVTVVSGMAIGIDGAAHRGALDAGGPTVGVLATGLDVVYPRRHVTLFRDVRGRGLLVSEASHGTGPHPARFPVRNRIIAGLASVVVVVEATAKGGARITADWALDYGVTVMAVPGSRRNPAAAGCNALIADGAIPVLDPADVLTAIGRAPEAAMGWEPAGAAPRAPVGAGAASVHRALGGEPATPDQLASRTGLSPPQVTVALAELERCHWVTRERGMVWPR